MGITSTKIEQYIRERTDQGKHIYALQGGRRSGKTYSILFVLLAYCCQREKIVVNVASMTSEQGRLGAYADAKNIIADSPYFSQVFEILSQPREIRNKTNKSVIFFNSYANSETAKGVACDFLFINEANNFSKQQYTDLMANVRRGVFLDFNPNIKFWVDDYLTEDDICVTTWQDNRYLTEMQFEYFANLKRLAEKPRASAVDIRNYRVYYLGEYSELVGNIFTPDNIRWVSELPSGLRNFSTFSDPSALRGADWFASVLSAQDADGNTWIVDTYSTNSGCREDIVRQLERWGRGYDIANYYIETNGLVGIDFFEFAQNSGLPVTSWYSRGNKFNRIVDNYQDLTTRMLVLDTQTNREYFAQVYDFAERCDHDDNIDAVNSSLMVQKMLSDW